VADIDTFVRAEAGSLVDQLAAWCAIPSISTQPEHDADVRRSAEHLAGLMEAAGLHAEVLAMEGSQPAVYALEELSRPEVVAALRAWRG
jgi:hypothetical protein